MGRCLRKEERRANWGLNSGLHGSGGDWRHLGRLRLLLGEAGRVDWRKAQEGGGLADGRRNGLLD